MSVELIITLVIVGILALAFLYASGVRWYASRILIWLDLKKLELNLPMEQYVRTLLDEQGLVDVEIKKAGFFSSLFIGNTYSVKKKRINLHWFTARRTSIGNLARAGRLIGLAKMHAEGAKNLRAVEFTRWFGWLPILFIPLIIIGLIVDLIAGESVGLYTLIFFFFCLVLVLFTLIMSFVALKSNFKAYDIGREIILNMQILGEKETKKFNSLIKTWKQLDVINVIITTFELIYFVFKIILSSIKLFGRR